MNNDSFHKDSITLICSNLTTGVLGFVFSIILSKELGAEGMGLYGLVMPIYNLFICLICGGMVAALSKVSSIYYSKNDLPNLKKSVNTSLYFDFIWSLIVILFVLTISVFISYNIIKDSRTLYSIWAICPALTFVALSSILKGYFYGISDMRVPAVIDILEKGLRIFIIVFIIGYFNLQEIKDTVTGAYIALSIGELVSFICLFLIYKQSSKNIEIPKRTEGRAQLLFNVLAISFPLCLNGFLSTIISTFTTLMVPRRLVSIGILYNNALSLIGRFSGMSLSIIFFPLIIVSSISTVLVPHLSRSISQKDYYSIEKIVSEVIRISLGLGLITLTICFVIPTPLGKLFFSRNDLGEFIKFASLSAPFVYLASSTLGILNGLGKQNILLRNSLLISIEELILLFILTGIPSINIFGYGISLIITSITMIALNLYEIKKQCSFEFPVDYLFLQLLICGLIYFILLILLKILPDDNFTIKYVLVIIFGYAFYYGTQPLLNKV